MGIEQPEAKEKSLTYLKADIARQLGRYLSDKDRQEIILNGLSRLSDFMSKTEAQDIMNKIIEEVREMWEKTKPPDIKRT